MTHHLDVSVVSATWGNYWSRFSRRWLDALQNLLLPPGEVVIASDAPLTGIPSNIRVIPAEPPYFYDAWFQAIAAASRPFVFMCALDDELMPTALCNIPPVQDVVYGPQLQLSPLQPPTTLGPDPDGFRKILTSPRQVRFPCSGWNIFRRETYLAYPQRRTVWADWIMAMELKYHHARVSFDSEVRSIYHLHPGQHSVSQGHVEARRNVELFRRDLVSHRVIPGLEWPPRLANTPYSPPKPPQ